MHDIPSKIPQHPYNAHLVQHLEFLRVSEMRDGVNHAHYVGGDFNIRRAGRRRIVIFIVIGAGQYKQSGKYDDYGTHITPG
jgi:hypothetical protein